MIQRVIENLNIEFDEHFEFIIICLLEDYEKYDFSIFDDIIGHDFWEVICLPDVTEGGKNHIMWNLILIMIHLYLVLTQTN